MSDPNHIKSAMGQDDELTVIVQAIDDTIAAKIIPDHITHKSVPIKTTINRGIGYIYAGIFNIIRDILFYPVRFTKGRHKRVTKAGNVRISSRELQ